jgi:hypothetical protein
LKFDSSRKKASLQKLQAPYILHQIKIHPDHKTKLNSTSSKTRKSPSMTFSILPPTVAALAAFRDKFEATSAFDPINAREMTALEKTDQLIDVAVGFAHVRMNLKASGLMALGAGR